MKLEVVIRDNTSAITVTAETEFEKEMLKLASQHKAHSMRFQIEDSAYYEGPLRSAAFSISFWNEDAHKQ